MSTSSTSSSEDESARLATCIAAESRSSNSSDSSPLGLPLCICCLTCTTKKIHALGVGAVCQALGTCFNIDDGTAMKMPSDTLQKVLVTPEYMGGYGVDPHATVVLCGSLEDVEFAKHGGM